MRIGCLFNCFGKSWMIGGGAVVWVPTLDVETGLGGESFAPGLLNIPNNPFPTMLPSPLEDFMFAIESAPVGGDAGLGLGESSMPLRLLTFLRASWLRSSA